jgi:hypothetical protein
MFGLFKNTAGIVETKEEPKIISNVSSALNTAPASPMPRSYSKMTKG